MNILTRASALIATLAAVASLATSAVAQAPATVAPVCPARYEPIDGHCYNNVSGDIVLATTSTSTNANCRAGYTILHEAVCYSSVTGDVELADVGAKVVQSTGVQR